MTHRSRFRAIALAVVALSALAPLPAARAEGWEFEFEGGVASASRVDVRIPGDGGTRFSLVDDLSSGSEGIFRARIGYRFSDRHFVSALYAPFELEVGGTFDRDVDFAGERFEAGSPVRADYRFDSYRLTYRYGLVRTDELEIGAGFTAKVRDAEIRLSDETGSASKTDTGFVPLLHAHLAWQPGGGPFGLLVDVDALAAPQGRAEDLLVAGTWRVRPGVDLRLGYRMVEGGADNDEVYTFSWFHAAVAGVRIAF